MRSLRVGLVALCSVLFALGPRAALANTYIGDDGPDMFIGTDNADTFWTYGGNDTVSGQLGNDDIHLGDNRDEGDGDGGADSIYGGDSPQCCPWEFLDGGPGGDSLYDSGNPFDGEAACGRGGDDYLNVLDSDGHDFAAGGVGSDTVYADNGDSATTGDATCPP